MEMEAGQHFHTVRLGKHGHLFQLKDLPILDKIVFIDSTWNQCHKISEDPRIRGLPRVMINSRHTLFWRYQAGKPKEYLSTIEAIYYLCVDYQKIILEEDSDGKFDNLLYFFKFMYEKIHELYPEAQT